MATDHERRQAPMFCSESAQRDDYRPPRLPGRPALPASRARLCLPFTGTATSSDYRPFPSEALLATSAKRSEPLTNHIYPEAPSPPSSSSSAAAAATDRGSSSWNSTHRDAFRFRQQPQSETPRAHSARRLVLPFTGQSTSRADFQAPPADVVRCSRPNSASLKMLCDRDDLHVADLLEKAKFEGTSSYSTEYKAYPLPDSQSTLQYDHHLDAPLPFEGVTECQAQYRPISFEQAPKSRPDNKTFVSSISSPGSVFEGTTEFLDSFRPIPIERNDSVLEPYPLDPPIPFEATTESRDNYRPLQFYETPKQLSSSGR